MPGLVLDPRLLAPRAVADRATAQVRAFDVTYSIGPASVAGALTALSMFAAGAADEHLAAGWICFAIIAWTIYDPYLFAVVLMPFLIPFGTIQILPGVPFTYLLAGTTAAMIGCVVRPGPLVRGFQRIPRSTLIGLFGLLAAYLASMLVNGYTNIGAMWISTHTVRTLQVVLVFASVYRLADGRLMLVGFVIAGCACLFAGPIVWYETGDLLAAYSTPVMPLGSVLGVSLLIAKSSAFATFSAIAAFALAEQARRLWSRAALFVLGAGFLGASLFSGRREALLAIAGAALIAMFTGRKRTYRIGIVALVALAAVFLYWAGPLRTFLQDRASIFAEFTGGGTGRWPLLIRSIELWWERPWLGYGPGMHSTVLWNASDLGEGGVAAHNSISGAMVEAGLVGGAFVVILVLGFVANWWRVLKGSWRFPSESGWSTLILPGAATLFSAAAVWDFVNHSGYMLLFGMLTAWIVRVHEAQRIAARSPDGTVRLPR